MIEQVILITILIITLTIIDPQQSFILLAIKIITQSCVLKKMKIIDNMPILRHIGTHRKNCQLLSEYKKRTRQ